MSSGIVLENCSKGSFSGCEFIGGEVGISAVDSDFVISDSKFNGVGTAIKCTGQTSIDASNVTHSEFSQASPARESHWGGDATSLEIIKVFANANV
ncbi:hypothetical protein [Pseudomonas bubulae]|uniref:hypothetical protein n=1 Tax=Pseudomonas bubulae TaxID=2316085 RepID=UPI00309F0091